MRSDTTTIIGAMRILAEDIQSDDGVANAAIYEAAERLEELLLAHNRYEAVRKCSPRKFSELYDRNMKGERFDTLIDELIKYEKY